MRIGVPSEIKVHEYRVGLTPASVRELVSHGHSVMVQTGAGDGSGMTDADYRTAGAEIAPVAELVFATSDMIVKVKEPQPKEFNMLKKDQILFTYLHLAPDPDQAAALQKAGVVGIAYETVTDSCGRLPLLAPMSEVAGRMSVHIGAHYLEKTNGGSGILLSGVPGVEPAKVVILGGGVVGSNAAQIAVGMGADVTLFDKATARLAMLDQQYGGRLRTVYATSEAIERHVKAADLVIGAVLLPGASAPRLVTRSMIAGMKKGSVIVDVAIDQGGCVEGARPATHTDPIFSIDGVTLYCVANIPGAVARTSTCALNNATLPYVLALADKGWRQALADDKGLSNGLNVADGKILHAAVIEALRATKAA